MASTISIHDARSKSNFERECKRRVMVTRAERADELADHSLQWSVIPHDSGLELVGSLCSRRIVLPNKKRGKQVGCSRQSMRRFRLKLIRYSYDNSFACALTVPNYVGTEPENAFKSIGRHIERFGVSALVWRKEVTRRLRVHYHLIVWPFPGFDCCDCFGRLVRAWVDALFIGATCSGQLCAELGWDPGDWSLIEREHPGMIEDTLNRLAVHRDILADARGKALRVNLCDKNFRVIDSKDGYIRYILDHTSKHKDYQAKTTGRPWGVMGSPPSDNALPVGLTDSQICLLLRVLRKSSRYRVYCKCLFGHKRAFGKHYSWARLAGGRYCQFGGYGSRLLDWVRQATE